VIEKAHHFFVNAPKPMGKRQAKAGSNRVRADKGPAAATAHAETSGFDVQHDIRSTDGA
jgi:hypothetical protein